MAKSIIRLMSRLLLIGILVGIAVRAEAGTSVTVVFNGTGVGTDGVPVTFAGHFVYDQAQSGTTSGGWTTFTFKGNVAHVIYYQIDSQTPVSGEGMNCEPFTIKTSGYLFVLTAQSPKGTTVTITLPTAVALTTSLPFCESISNAETFPTSALAGSTFTLTTSAGTTFSGTITTTGCSPQTSHVKLSPPLQPVIEYPAPCPVYVCQPRPACCLSGLFHRRSYRVCCR
jgi:hypothetical protein